MKVSNETLQEYATIEIPVNDEETIRAMAQELLEYRRASQATPAPSDELQKKDELLLAAKCAKEVIHKTLVAISVHNAASKDKIKLKSINSLSNAFARLKEATEKPK